MLFLLLSVRLRLPERPSFRRVFHGVDDALVLVQRQRLPSSP